MNTNHADDGYLPKTFDPAPLPKQKSVIGIMLLGIMAEGIFVLLILLATGCATRLVLAPAVPAVTNTVTGSITPAVPAVITNVPNQTLATVVNGAQAAAPLLPPPYGTLLTTILGLITVGSGLVAARANSQKNTAQTVAKTIIQGVESVGPAAVAVKQAVAAHALANGVSDDVKSAVAANTIKA
jgi:hypothetical protein